ncbi:LysM peptidoglycan-binding domain-containing protein [Peribacillus sp. JNUCC 23]
MKKTIFTISTAAVIASMVAPSAFADSYTVKKGDSLYKIAQVKKTTVANLKEINKLESDAIYVDQVLLIDHKSTPKDTQSTSLITFNKTNPTIHTVVSGDSLIKIANKYGITLGELKNLNALSSTVIYPGDKIIISETKNSTVVELPSTETNNTQNIQSYAVKNGDSLWKIANNNGTTISNIKTINNLSSDTIYPGQVLQLTKSSETSNVTKPSNGVSDVNAVKPAQPQAGSTTYTVKAGDTLSKIASQFGMTVNQLITANQLNTDTIYIGQSLVTKNSTSASESQQVADPSSDVTNQQVSALIDIAKKQLGTPYVWAGSSPGGFDCSGFIYYVFKKAGYQVPRVSSSTYFDMGKSVKTPQPGDLIFFDTTTNSKAVISHMGIYIGNNEFIHASSSQGVTITSINNSYFKNRIMGYKSL